jgi:hypothetical protein
VEKAELDRLIALGKKKIAKLPAEEQTAVRLSALPYPFLVKVLDTLCTQLLEGSEAEKDLATALRAIELHVQARRSLKNLGPMGDALMERAEELAKGNNQ